MIEIDTSKHMSKSIDENERFMEAAEPQHSGEPILQCPKQEKPLMVPPEIWDMLESNSLAQPTESITD